MVLDGESNEAQDALHQKDGQPSAEDGNSPSKKAPKTYTEEEVNRRHSTLDKTIAVLTKERDQAKQDLEATNSRLDELQRRIDEAEEEGVRAKPEAHDIWKQRKELRDLKNQLEAEKRQLDKDTADHQDALRQIEEMKAESSISKIASSKGVDPELLKAKCKKLGLTTEDQITEMADTLASIKPQNTEEKPEEEGKKPLNADSNLHSGALGKITNEQANKMSMEEYRAARKKQDPHLL
jgi:chromosome segregation ATPase